MTELIGSALMGLSASLAIITVPFAVMALRDQHRAKQDELYNLATPIDWPLTWEEILAANDGFPPGRIHCFCGKFASKDDEMPGLVHCANHGMVFLSPQTGPIPVVPVTITEPRELVDA